MSKFLSGPPGGRTLLHTTTRLSDLDGGVFGPGASVASTGLNAHRAVIKAASARQAGETWEDVLEYYMVGNLLTNSLQIGTKTQQSSTQTEAKLTSRIALARFST
jgi:hypothetical protein